MLSILIPLYNYDAHNLINTIYKFCTDNVIVFEIIVCNDYSEDTFELNFTQENIIIISNTKNIGRTETRQKLANNAKYDWLLFLDADVLPVNSNFINEYIKIIKSTNCDVSFGGFKYENKTPSSDKILRWKYGRQKEDISPNLRNQNPYKVIISANLLIQKTLFKSINTELKGNHYGYDTIFSLRLKEQDAKIMHIDNPVWHLGLEMNSVYLSKKERATKTILKLYKAKQITAGSNDLLKTFELIKKLHLIKIIAYFFKKTKKLLRINILGTKPSIVLLNTYKLGYFCNNYSNEN